MASTLMSKNSHELINLLIYKYLLIVSALGKFKGGLGLFSLVDWECKVDLPTSGPP